MYKADIVRTIPNFLAMSVCLVAVWYKSQWFSINRSESGVVNIYDINQCLTLRTPKPVKVVNNLLTSCTSLSFNSTSQLLSISSRNAERSVKLVGSFSLLPE